jgi:hypothetical protein
MLDNGSVVESNYFRHWSTTSITGIPDADIFRFMFSTIETPLDSEHPVAGNREMGIYRNMWLSDTVPPVYTFYSSAADRTWDVLTSAGNFLSWDKGFKDADRNWRIMQQKVIDYVNNNGGEAHYYINREITTRPDYEQVEKYLRKEITYAQMRHEMGCD